MTTARPALLIVDMFTRFDFPEAHLVKLGALRAARQIARLRENFRHHRNPVIYANDNFANWQMDFKELVDACLETPGASSTIAGILRPAADDYFVLKPKHSAFLATPLVVLLAKLGCNRLVITGMTADSCIAATCFDSNAREYETVVIAEAVAGISARKNRALQLLKESKAAKVASVDSYLGRSSGRQ